MPKFVTKTIKSVKGKMIFKQLIMLDNKADEKRIQAEIIEKETKKIEVEIKGELDIYEESLEVIYKRQFANILANMEKKANLYNLPKTKFKEFPTSDLVKEYEFKAGDLRVYAIKIPNGQLIILGGYKNSQQQDISRFRSLKRQYLESLKQ
jgi:hypothetical protein